MTGPSPRANGRSSIFIGVYIPTALLAFSQGVLLVTLPLYADSFGVSYRLISLAVAAAAIGTLVADVPAGALLERIGLRPAMLIGSSMVAVSTFALAFTEQFPHVVAFRLVAGIGTALWGLSRHAYITEAIPIAQRGQAISTFGGINRIGTFGGPVIGGLVAELAGLRGSFVLAASLGLGAFAISALLLQPAPRPHGRLARRVRWALVRRLLHANRRDLTAAAIAQSLAQMIRAGRVFIVPLYGADQLGLDPGQVGLIMSIGSILDVAMFFPAGVLMDRFGRKVAAVPSFATMAIGIGLIPFATDFYGLLGATAVIGLGNGIGSGTMMTLGADLAPPGATGEFLGLWRLIGDAGQMGGPLAVGFVASAAGLEGGAFVLSVFGIGAALILGLLVQETRVSPLSDSG